MGGNRTLQQTPTWAVAAVCAVFVIIFIFIEHGIHKLEEWFKKRQNKAMTEALEKMKGELMLLGFISFLLTVGTALIARICIPPEMGESWLPCSKGDGHDKDGGAATRHLLSYDLDVADDVLRRRSLAGLGQDNHYCAPKGKVSLISYTGVHQLHIFIFMLAVFHIIYSVVIIILGEVKMRKWKAWELETLSLEYEFSNDPTRFRFTRHTSFVRRHSGISTTPGIKWIVAFCRQFSGSISKVDYMTIRNGFINAHFGPNTKFDFHKYIRRSMEDDYKRVLGISVPLWFSAIIFLLFNFHKWHLIAWISLVPLVILVLVGTKLELVIMEMAEQIQERDSVVRGAPLVEPTNTFFWFNRPQSILFFIHFSLFENAFQIAYFLWSWYEFGMTSCVHENIFSIFPRVFLGVVLHILCSYITFPLYALVTQMGSHMKTAIFEEQTAKALKKWRKAARERNKRRHKQAAAVADDSFCSRGETTARPGGVSAVSSIPANSYCGTDLDAELSDHNNNFSFVTV